MKNLLKNFVIACLLLNAAGIFAQTNKLISDPVELRVQELLTRMTLEEKVGQMNQYSNPYVQTGAGANSREAQSFDKMIEQGQVGSFLNVLGANETRRLQEIAVEKSRLGIPLIFGFDVVHGFKTIFPIPLGEAASFDRRAMEQSARIAAIESAANGLHWTFAPMVDISRDARWGRIMESAGEDVYLGEQAAIARVKGFQGDDLSKANTIAACAKHFAAYGAAIAGRDYAAVDISERNLREVIFPPFKAALNAGVATFMSSFNTINGVPASGNAWLLNDVLRKEWGFKGFVVSDWNSLGEMMAHGNVESHYEVGLQGIEAGVDMDMEGRIYISEVKKLLDDKKINISQIDEMVARILRVKFQLGLFDNPFQYCDVEKQNKLTMHPDHLAAARDIARKSFVLLKNEKNVLPLSGNVKKIAVIGPLANDKDAPTGNWRGVAEPNSAVSLLEGIKAAVGSKAEVLYAEGCKLVTNPSQSFFTQLNVNTSDRSGFAEAVEVAKKADVVVMALGETAYMSGECRSYADISLKGLQAELLREIRKTGKPVVLTLFNGRPMVLTDIIDQTDALLVCWLPGTESGHAIADVLFGDYNPSGKLPASFPYHVGQVPVYYEQMTSGRPYDPNPEGFSTKYRDIPNTPLYAFGKGLSYTTFEYKNLRLSKSLITKDGSLTASVLVTNTGNFDGEEVVQLYIRDVTGKGISRPVQQLKGFEKVMIRKGETREVTFIIAASDLAFWRLNNTWAPEEGDFMLMVGSASDDIRLKEKFVLKD